MMSEPQQINSEISTVTTQNNVEGMEIDLREIFRRIISIRKTLYKAAIIGLVIGIIVAFSIPKKYTVNVTLSPEMGSAKSNNGLAGLAASFLGSNATMSEGADALNASLSTDIVSSTPFLLELFNMKVPVSEKDTITFETYLDEQSSPWWSFLVFLVWLLEELKPCLQRKIILLSITRISKKVLLNYLKMKVKK